MFPYYFQHARKDKDANIIPVCHCECHLAVSRELPDTPRPDAEHARLCAGCADESFAPWTAVLNSILR